MSTVTDRPSDAPGAAGVDSTGPDKPEGPIAAAILAAGVGGLALGVITTASEASASFAKALNWYNPVGPLSGKTIVSVAVWLVAWVVLHLVLRRRTYESQRALTVALVLIGLGVIGTFPTFFDLFAG